MQNIVIYLYYTTQNGAQDIFNSFGLHDSEKVNTIINEFNEKREKIYQTQEKIAAFKIDLYKSRSNKMRDFLADKNLQISLPNFEHIGANNFSDDSIQQINAASNFVENHWHKFSFDFDKQVRDYSEELFNYIENDKLKVFLMNNPEVVDIWWRIGYY